MILLTLACAQEEALAVPALLNPDFSSSIVLLDSGHLTVAELHLVDGEGLEVGRVPGEHELDLLGDAVDLGTAELQPSGWTELRGEVLEASFLGSVTLEDGEQAFDLVLGEQDGRFYGGEVQDELPETGEALPGELIVTFQGLLALSFVDWNAGDTDGDGLLTEADGRNAEALAWGIRSGLSWSIDVQEAR